MAYRADIDGLRALAVTLVVLFHAKLGLFSGGFIGVDVFFVISGFLISSIIANDVATGRFSICQFYARRARRILPALLVVLFASTVAALFLLVLPQDLETFARSARATLLFCSNFFFSRAGDYFKPALETQPLLHTWSLGVEEQFYLVAPFLLAPLMVSTQRRAWGIFVAVFIVFLLLSQQGVLRSGSKAFYWPHTRAFELMIGVAVASPLLKPMPDKVRTFASAAGLMMIVLAALTFTSKMVFPGFAAMLPTIGAAMLIWSGKSGETAISRALSTTSMVSVGKISYPLYLWHWPIFVFAGLLPTPLTSPADRVALIVLALVCATATYYLLEVPVRRFRIDATRRPIILKVAAIAIIIDLIPLQALIWSGGWPQRFGLEVARFTQKNPTSLTTPGLCLKSHKAWSTLVTDCMIGDAHASAATFILWGDSHGRMLAPAISEIAKMKGLKGYFIARGGCEPLMAPPDGTKLPIKCREATDRVFQLLRDVRITRVILVGRWAVYHTAPSNSKDAANINSLGVSFDQALSMTVRNLTAGDRQLILTGPVPEPLFNVPLTMTRALIEGMSDSVSIPRSAFDRRNEGVLKALAEAGRQVRVRLIYPHHAFCDTHKCLASADGYALYVDDNHLSPHGVEKLNGLLSRIFDVVPIIAQSSSTP
jgi:peptidoglycan/LPS O-acetylase OafA/YrhL